MSTLQEMADIAHDLNRHGVAEFSFPINTQFSVTRYFGYSCIKYGDVVLFNTNDGKYIDWEKEDLKKFVIKAFDKYVQTLGSLAEHLNYVESHNKQNNK